MTNGTRGTGGPCVNATGGPGDARASLPARPSKAGRRARQGAAMSAVYEAGGVLMSHLFGTIPTEAEVVQAENFTEPEPEQLTA